MKKLLKDIPEEEKTRADIVLILGISASAILFIFAFSNDGNNGYVGNLISFILGKLGFIKFLVCTMPIEMAMNYFKKHIFYKYYLKKSFKSKPPFLIQIIKFIIRKIQFYCLQGGKKVEQ